VAGVEWRADVTADVAAASLPWRDPCGPSPDSLAFARIIACAGQTSPPLTPVGHAVAVGA